MQLYETQSMQKRLNERHERTTALKERHREKNSVASTFAAWGNSTEDASGKLHYASTYI